MKQLGKTLNQTILIVITMLHLSNNWRGKEIVKSEAAVRRCSSKLMF